MKKFAIVLITSLFSILIHPAWALTPNPQKAKNKEEINKPLINNPVVETKIESNPIEQKGDPIAGQIKATAICSGCHGMPGARTAYPEVYSVPKIAGQNEAYLVSALTSYRGGNRYHGTMIGLATALSEKEVRDIAAYYANPAFGKTK